MAYATSEAGRLCKYCNWYQYSTRYNNDCVREPCHKTVTQDIIHVACLLRRKLLPYFIPAILEYAGMVRKIALYTTWSHWPDSAQESFFVRKGFVIPPYVPRGSLREIRFMSQINRAGPGRNATGLDEEETWYEAVVTGLDGEETHIRHPVSFPPICPPPPELASYKYGAQRLATYMKSGKLVGGPPTGARWTLESNDRSVRQILKEVKGGSLIEVRGSTRAGPDEFGTQARLWIMYTVVSKM